MKQPKEILFVRELNNGTLWHVQYTMDNDDGDEIVHSHVFPKDTLDWRAAEYGFDPADTRTILYCILMEPWEEQDQKPENDHGEHYVHTLPQAAARAEKLRRNGFNKVKLTKGKNKGMSLADDPAFDVIHQQGVKDPHRLDEKKKVVDGVRQHMRTLAAMRKADMVQLGHVPPAATDSEPPPAPDGRDPGGRPNTHRDLAR
jgi:hypothetical protein